MSDKLIVFIGAAKFDEYGGGYIWGVTEKGGHQMLAEVRAYGAIQNLFIDNKGVVDFDKANKFQDELGKFIADAINEKIDKYHKNSSLATCKKCGSFIFTMDGKKCASCGQVV